MNDVNSIVVTFNGALIMLSLSMWLILVITMRLETFWTASGCSGPSIVGGSKLGPTERELASHQHSRTVAAILYNVAV